MSELRPRAELDRATSLDEKSVLVFWEGSSHCEAGLPCPEFPMLPLSWSMVDRARLLLAPWLAELGLLVGSRVGILRVGTCAYLLPFKPGPLESQGKPCGVMWGGGKLFSVTSLVEWDSQSRSLKWCTVLRYHWAQVLACSPFTCHVVQVYLCSFVRCACCQVSCEPWLT